jgi:hypothetical protein
MQFEATTATTNTDLIIPVFQTTFAYEKTKPKQ